MNASGDLGPSFTLVQGCKSGLARLSVTSEGEEKSVVHTGNILRKNVHMSGCQIWIRDKGVDSFVGGDFRGGFAVFN